MRTSAKHWRNHREGFHLEKGIRAFSRRNVCYTEVLTFGIFWDGDLDVCISYVFRRKFPDRSISKIEDAVRAKGEDTRREVRKVR